jgi:hypothetical protein
VTPSGRTLLAVSTAAGSTPRRPRAARRCALLAGLASVLVVSLAAGDARADLAIWPGVVGSRLFYAGLEVQGRVAKTTPDESAVHLAVGPVFELHFAPRWSVQAQGSLSIGFGDVYPDSWWQVGARGVWRATPWQHLDLGLAVGQATVATYSRSAFGPFVATGTRTEDVSPQLDLGVGIWEFDFDPIRLGPTARFAVSLTEGSWFLALGVQAEHGWGAIDTDE